MAPSPHQKSSRDALYRQIALSALLEEDLGIDEPHDDDPPLYFQRPHTHQPSESQIGQAERDLATAIIRGRTLLQMRDRVQPSITSEAVVDDAYLMQASNEILANPEACVDRIVDILQVAKAAGWNVAELCGYAIALQRVRYAKALADARRLRGAR
jgi:hypothetical protein